MNIININLFDNCLFLIPVLQLSPPAKTDRRDMNEIMFQASLNPNQTIVIGRKEIHVSLEHTIKVVLFYNIIYIHI